MHIETITKHVNTTHKSTSNIYRRKYKTIKGIIKTHRIEQENCN
jgi:hypothetical protein